MNLIKDRWIPAQRADGSNCTIAPFEIGTSQNPVVAITPSRPDFRGALYQFIIGLVQTAFAPVDEDEWLDLWNRCPSCEELKIAFEKFVDAFELENSTGPAFMQDFDLLAEANESEIRALLIDAPGENTVKKNCDHFIKRGTIGGLCDACAAMALFSLQTNAPSGGQGHRTGLRGGGPLNTIVLSDLSAKALWGVIWLNTLPLSDRFTNSVTRPVETIFPWLTETRISQNDIKTFPEEVDERQMYWAMPRRIRLSQKCVSGKCDLCNQLGAVWTTFRTKNYGISYSSTWQHVLSPFRRQKEKDGSISILAIKGKQGGFAYPDWLSLTFGFEETESAAFVVKHFIEKKTHLIKEYVPARLWCFGYDMDNMKARCWYDQTMPLINMPEEKCQEFTGRIRIAIEAAEETSKCIRDKVKSAWLSNPKDAAGDTSYIVATFWEETEAEFFLILEKLRHCIETEQPTDKILSNWRKILINAAIKLFDRLAMNESDEPRNMKRIALAAKSLDWFLCDNKSLNALKGE